MHPGSDRARIAHFICLAIVALPAGFLALVLMGSDSPGSWLPGLGAALGRILLGLVLAYATVSTALVFRWAQSAAAAVLMHVGTMVGLALGLAFASELGLFP